MKKIILGISIISCFVSCQSFDKKEDAAQTETLDSIAKDSIVGADKDSDGCLASAGYTWSKLKKECVRVFTGIQLLPSETTANADDAVLAAYLLFDESKDNVEVFLPNEDESIILKRESEGKPWIGKNWQLIPWKGFQLKKDDKILFSGDGIIGNKVSGSDDSEEIPVTE